MKNRTMPRRSGTISLRRVRCTTCAAVLLLLLCSAMTNAASLTAQDSLPAEINALLEPELEQEFGPLEYLLLSDEMEMWGRVIAIDYVLPADKRLDNDWGRPSAAQSGCCEPWLGPSGPGPSGFRTSLRRADRGVS